MKIKCYSLLWFPSFFLWKGEASKESITLFRDFILKICNNKFCIGGGRGIGISCRTQPGAATGFDAEWAIFLGTKLFQELGTTLEKKGTKLKKKINKTQEKGTKLP